MIYYFGVGDKVSMITSERYLTTEEMAQASLTAEFETEPLVIDGKRPVRYIDPITKQFSWVYVDKPIPTNEKVKLAVEAGLITPEQYFTITGTVYTA